jgi:hypothetical protein
MLEVLRRTSTTHTVAARFVSSLSVATQAWQDVKCLTLPPTNDQAVPMLRWKFNEFDENRKWQQQREVKH